jgi:predicted RNase H-like nuclease (RuvC/YqgF family)
MSIKTQADDSARLREKYEQRIREMENKHREDMEQLRGAHQTALQKQLESNDKRAHDLQDEFNYKLSQKDLGHQKEIEAIKSIYAKKLGEKGSG